MNNNVCKALENVNDQEWQEVKEQVSSINRWRYMVMGGMAVVIGLMGLMTLFVKRALDNSSQVTLALNGLSKELAVFRQEVQPFILAGPRFTQLDYERNIKADASDIKEWARVEFDKQHIALENVRTEIRELPPQWLRDDIDSNASNIKSLMLRIEALEKNQ